MAKQDEILAKVNLLNIKLYGENGFEGDITEIKNDIKTLTAYVHKQSEKLAIVETLQKERNRPSKKSVAGWVSGSLALAAALWKSFLS